MRGKIWKAHRFRIEREMSLAIHLRKLAGPRFSPLNVTSTSNLTVETTRRQTRTCTRKRTDRRTNWRSQTVPQPFEARSSTPNLIIEKRPLSEGTLSSLGASRRLFATDRTSYATRLLFLHVVLPSFASSFTSSSQPHTSILPLINRGEVTKDGAHLTFFPNQRLVRPRKFSPVTKKVYQRLLKRADSRRRLS